MKRILAALLFCLLPVLACGADVKAVSEKAEKLVQQGKYASALKVLGEKDLALENPALFKRYVDIVLGQNVSQIGFRTFFARDLKKGESLEEARGKADPEDFVEEDLEAAVKTVITGFPEDPNANYAAGKYIYEGLECRCATFEKFPPYLQSVYPYYLKAKEGGVFDYISLFRLGFLRQLQGGEENTAKALEFYHLALDLKKDYPPLRYNLGVLYFMVGFPEIALEHATAALGGYKDSEHEADASHLLARVEEVLEKTEDAKKHFRHALELNPLHEFAFSDYAAFLRRSGDAGGYKKTVLEGILRDPSNPALFTAYLNVVMGLGANAEDKAILKEIVSGKYEDPETEGVVFYNAGQLAEISGDSRAALEYYSRSMESFKKSGTEKPEFLEGLRKMIDRQKK
ncbi:tetratricopeptide repeat protein [bacterium]|nr:MAG: tetratricopeptide repeat protein [bacterium]